MILAGDIGGTHTRVALFESGGGIPKPVVIETFPSRGSMGLDAIVRRFIEGHNPIIEYACFGVAGPVKSGRSETSNLAWVVDALQLSIKTVRLINDLEASAYGIALLEPKDIFVLNEGVPNPGGNMALISAGTGLGEAGLHWDGDHYQPFPSEGGHADFAPRSELEVELLLYLLKQYGHVSFERVLSGPGLYNIYKFLRDTGRGEEPAWLTEQMNQQDDPSAVISRAALEGSCKLCVHALDLFVSIYGSEAGNLALKLMATGGVYVGGGIAPKIIQKLMDSTFMKAFVSKGRMKSLLEAIPVRVILNDNTALLGAARLAMIEISKT
ncbi:MAG: glucokinase [Candidatus Dadabacteria bacterium]